jgi:pimeloyl-ACP methyl ester carboxylesterase
MADYAEIGGVRTWFDEHGKGDPLVLMHGGLTDARLFGANIDALADHFHVYTPERRGHGHTPDVEGPLTYDAMARDTVEFLETVVGGPAHLVGWSDGANVAILTALQRPDLVRRMILVSGNFHHEGAVLEVLAETDVDPSAVPPPMEPLAVAYGEVSPDGPEHFLVLLRKVMQMVTTSPTLTTDDLERITHRTLVMAGDDDMITLEHTVALYRALRDSELAVIPGASHFLLQEKPAMCNTLMVDFLTNEPAPTMMPIRRGAA